MIYLKHRQLRQSAEIASAMRLAMQMIFSSNSWNIFSIRGMSTKKLIWSFLDQPVQPVARGAHSCRLRKRRPRSSPAFPGWAGATWEGLKLPLQLQDMSGKPSSTCYLHIIWILYIYSKLIYLKRISVSTKSPHGFQQLRSLEKACRKQARAKAEADGGAWAWFYKRLGHIVHQLLNLCLKTVPCSWCDGVMVQYLHPNLLLPSHERVHTFWKSCSNPDLTD